MASYATDTKLGVHGQKQNRSRYPYLYSQKKVTRVKVSTGHSHHSHRKAPNSLGVNLSLVTVVKRCVWIPSIDHSAWMKMGEVHRPYKVVWSVVQTIGCQVYRTRKRFRFPPRLAQVPARILIAFLRTITSACRRFTTLHGKSLMLELLNQRNQICPLT